MTQNQIAGNTTSSGPFVAPGDVIYFRGTDNRLLCVTSDGTSGFQIGENTTSSSPVVFSDPASGQWVYFRGTDNRLLKVRGDQAGSELTWIGKNSTNAAPFVTLDANTNDVWIYFQGTDNRLLKVKGDGSEGFQIGTNTTDAAPFVYSDPLGGEWVYFRGHYDNKLWKVIGDQGGSGLTQIGTNTTSSTPFVTLDVATNEVWVYFQGTDNTLWKVRNDAAGSGLQALGATRSTPYVTEDGWVYFQGTEWLTLGNTQIPRGKLWRVFNDGTQPAQLGDNYTASTPMVGAMQFAGGQLSRWVYFQEALSNDLVRYLQTDLPLTTGTARPKYYILTVLYAPPGTTGGKSTSTVDYGSSSATGTTTTLTNSVDAGLSISLTGKDTSTPPETVINAQFSFSQNTADTSSIAVQKTQTFDIKMPGPATDGINHDHDVFVLLLNPLLEVAVFPGNNVQVAMGVDGPTMDIQYVYAGWLRGVTPFASGVLQQLETAGLIDEDYQQILSTNPFQAGSNVIDTNRFAALPQSFAYEPPYSASDAPWTATYTVQNTATSTQTTTVTYTVGTKITLFGVFTSDDSIKITNTNITTDITTETASVTVGGPSFSYSGPTTVLVYWDTIYHSYMFAFPASEVIVATNPADSRNVQASSKGRKAVKKSRLVTPRRR